MVAILRQLYINLSQDSNDAGVMFLSPLFQDKSFSRFLRNIHICFHCESEMFRWVSVSCLCVQYKSGLNMVSLA